MGNTNRGGGGTRVHRQLRSDSSSQDGDFHQRAAAATYVRPPNRIQSTNVAQGDKLEKRIIYPNYDEYEGEVLNTNFNQALPGQNENSPNLQ